MSGAVVIQQVPKVFNQCNRYLLVESMRSPSFKAFDEALQFVGFFGQTYSKGL